MELIFRGGILRRRTSCIVYEDELLINYYRWHYERNIESSAAKIQNANSLRVPLVLSFENINIFAGVNLVVVRDGINTINIIIAIIFLCYIFSLIISIQVYTQIECFSIL